MLKSIAVKKKTSSLPKKEQ
jgi:hypothetical protein